MGVGRAEIMKHMRAGIERLQQEPILASFMYHLIAGVLHAAVTLMEVSDCCLGSCLREPVDTRTSYPPKVANLELL